MRREIKGSAVLVTGGAGFIGSHLTDKLIGEGAAKVIAVDNMFLGRLSNLQPAISKGAAVIKDDCENDGTLEYIVEKHRPDIVFNCATKALNYSFENPLNAFMTNVNIIRHLLELQRKGAFGTLCHFSTSEVYGTAVYEPMDEAHPFNPTTAYAAGKAATDVMLNAYVSQYAIDAFIVRPFNNYGQRQNHEGVLAGVIPTTIRRILRGEQPVVHGTGQQSRDFIYVHDTVDALLKLYKKLPKGESVNISTNGQITIESLITQICDYMGYRGGIQRLPARSADVKCHNASNAKLKQLIDFEPTPFADGLAKTIDWYKEVIE
jgi:UDP-glucose 4-epimerase